MNALLTDLYQLTMAQAYFELGMNEIAVRALLHRSARWRRAGVAEFSAVQPNADHAPHRHL